MEDKKLLNYTKENLSEETLKIMIEDNPIEIIIKKYENRLLIFVNKDNKMGSIISAQTVALDSIDIIEGNESYDIKILLGDRTNEMFELMARILIENIRKMSIENIKKLKSINTYDNLIIFNGLSKKENFEEIKKIVAVILKELEFFL